MSEQIQPTEQHKAPQMKAELQEGDITMKISKAPKEKKQATEKKEVPYLDDHVETYGKNLMSSIANLIEQSKQEKPKRKKKEMSPEMLERCRANLAKGRETIRKKREAQKNKPSPAPAPAPAPQPSIPKPQPVSSSEPMPIPVKAVAQPVHQPPISMPQPTPAPPERIRLRYGERLF